MLIGFEDKFMDAQARIISLCIELLETSNISADKIYVYIFQNEAQDFINALYPECFNSIFEKRRAANS
jgi:superfamily I DNA and RNA helicase